MATAELAEFLRTTGPPESGRSSSLLAKIHRMLHSKTTKRAPLPPIRYSQIPYVIDYKTQCGGDCGVQMTPRGNNSGHSDTNSEPASASHTVHNVAHQIGALKKSLLHEHSRRLLAEQRASRAEELARNVLDRLSRYE